MPYVEGKERLIGQRPFRTTGTATRLRLVFVHSLRLYGAKLREKREKKMNEPVFEVKTEFIEEETPVTADAASTVVGKSPAKRKNSFRQVNNFFENFL